MVLLTDTHVEQSLVPALDDLTGSDSESERLVSVKAKRDNAFYILR